MDDAVASPPQLLNPAECRDTGMLGIGCSALSCVAESGEMNDGNTPGTGVSDLNTGSLVKTLFRYSSNSSFSAGLEACAEAGRFT